MALERKKPCSDCKMCQFCSEARCKTCRGERCKHGNTNLSIAQQIALFNRMNPGLAPEDKD